MFEHHGALSAAGRLGEAEFDRCFGVLGGRKAFDAGQLLDALLGLGCLAGLSAEAVDEILEVLDLALLVFVSGEVLLVAGFFLEEVVVVVAAVAVEMLPRDFHDAVADGVEESAVVGNDEQRAGVGREMALEPTECFEVEVVGRLIKHEKIGFHDEQAGEVGAHDPSAAHGAGGDVEVGLAEGEAGENAFGFGFEVVTVVLDEGGDGFVMFGRVFARESAKGGIGLGHGRGCAGGELEHGFFSGGCAFLGEEADGASALEIDRAFVGGIVAEDEGEEGRCSEASAKRVRPPKDLVTCEMVSMGASGRR